MLTSSRLSRAVSLSNVGKRTAHVAFQLRSRLLAVKFTHKVCSGDWAVMLAKLLKFVVPINVQNVDRRDTM